MNYIPSVKSDFYTVGLYSVFAAFQCDKAARNEMIENLSVDFSWGDNSHSLIAIDEFFYQWSKNRQGDANSLREFSVKLFGAEYDETLGNLYIDLET